MAAIVCSQWSPWYGLAAKDFQEFLGPFILFVATLVAFGLAVIDRRAFLKWQAFLTVSLLCRELHFFGTDNGIYVALAVLLWYFARHLKSMQPFAGNRRVTTCFWGALWLYVLAMVFDRGYGRDLIPAIKPLRDAFEESLESTGHVLILSMVLASWTVLVRFRKGPAAGTAAREPRILRPSVIVAIPVVLLCWALVLRSEAKVFKPSRSVGQLPAELSSLAALPPSFGTGLFLASSDEDRALTLCSVDESGNAAFRGKLPLSVRLPSGVSLKLDDLEDLAFDGVKTYFAATSHREFSNEKESRRLKRSAGTERALVSFELEQSATGIRIVNARMVCSDLLERIRDRGVFETVNFHHSKTFTWRHLTSSWQVDLEGLAYVDGRLLLGFKNPVEDGRTAILSYDPGSGEVKLCGRYDFGGQGIHSLTYDRERDRLLAVTNDPFKESVGDSRLWVAVRDAKPGKWKFSAQPSVVLERADERLGRKASGLALAEGRLFVCFDDPQRPVIRSFPNP